MRRERVVFDTEPLIAHADDEPGSAVVEEYLNAVADGDVEGYVSYVNLTEIRYILAQKYDREIADGYVAWLGDLTVRPVGIDEVWETAAEFVLDYNPALADSFALATADHLDAVLLVGADADYDDLPDSLVERFRDNAA
jgi:predicted nucleic acid-binding protein